jgi:peptidoglycan/LPS O-acetylase OafA/YrhL
MGLVALLVVLPAVVGDRSAGQVRSLLGSRPAAFLGLVSYGVFLWHGPIVKELADQGVLDWAPQHSTILLTLVTLAVVVPIATLSYYAVERPFLRLKYRRTHRPGGSRPSTAPERELEPVS